MDPILTERLAIRRDTLPEVDLGYAFCPEFWGLGYAREAAEAWLAWGRTTLGLKVVLAIVSPGHAASIRLLEGLHFHPQSSLQLEPGDALDVYQADVYRAELT